MNTFLDSFNFEKLIAPHSSDEFFKEYFQKKPLIIGRNDPDYFRGLLDPADLDEIFFHWPNVLSTVSAGENDGRRSRLAAGVRQGQVQSVLRDLDEGKSLVLDALDNRHSPLTRMCATLEIEHGWRYQANVYLTPPGAQGFRTHIDDHNVFILQTTGKKTWRINSFRSPAELHLNTEPKTEIHPTDHQEFVLEQGDLVYIPKGFAHDAHSTEGGSVHITLGAHPPSWRSTLGRLLPLLVKGCPELEDVLPLKFADSGPEELAQDIRAWLQRLGKTDLEAACRSFMKDYREDFRGTFFGALRQRIGAEAIDLSDSFIQNTYLRTSRDRSGQEYRIKTPQKVIDLPKIFADQIEFCLSGKSFLGSEIPGMDDEERHVLLQRLLAEGLILRDD